MLAVEQQLNAVCALGGHGQVPEVQHEWRSEHLARLQPSWTVARWGCHPEFRVKLRDDRAICRLHDHPQPVTVSHFRGVNRQDKGQLYAQLCGEVWAPQAGDACPQHVEKALTY